MAVKHFYGKKEHSATYAAASLFMPGATARVEAIRAKKRKLKHASLPPPAPAPEAPSAVSPAADQVVPPSDPPTPAPAAPREQQANPPTNTSMSADRDEDHKPQVDAVDTESAMVMSMGAVTEEPPSLAEKHEKPNAAVAPAESDHRSPDEPGPQATAGVPASTPASAGDAERLTNSSGVAAPEVPQTEQPEQEDGPIPVEEAGHTEHHRDAGHEQAGTVDSTSANSPTPDASSSVSNKNNDSELAPISSDPREPAGEPAGELVEAVEVVQEVQNVASAPSPAEITPTENVAPTEIPTTQKDTPIAGESTTDHDDPTPAPSTTEGTEETETAHVSTSALGTTPDTPDKDMGNHSRPSSPSSPSRHAPIKISEVEWVKKHDFN